MKCITADSTIYTADNVIVTADNYEDCPLLIGGTRIGAVKVLVSNCIQGIYLRWWFNGWHYFNFTNDYEIQMKTESMGTQVTNFFSVISKIERPTRIKSEYSYSVTVEGIQPKDIGGFTGLLIAEKVEQYEGGLWREVDITRGEHTLKQEGQPAYELLFEITRKEIPASSSVYQKTLKLYLGDTLCDMDDDEVIPINKQTNDIAEMQDRQSDFTAQFRIRKTRAMRALFELSGEVGSNTDFPYKDQVCKLIQDNIEVITNGVLILDDVDDQYYFVSILSGNKNFFKAIENKKITDLTLASTNHNWTAVVAAASHASDLDYVYPLMEPSDDGGIAPLSDDGDNVNMYAGWIFPFIKVKAIWDEIFSNAGYICEGEVLSNPHFLKLFMPITNLKLSNINAYQYYYALYNSTTQEFLPALNVLPGGTLISGDVAFAAGTYNVPYDGTYKFRVVLMTSIYRACQDAYIRILGVDTQMTYNTVQSYDFVFRRNCVYELEYTATAGDAITFVVEKCYLYYYSIQITGINVTGIGYSSPVVTHLHLPSMSQTDFVKMICNMFGLIPDVTPRDRKIKFWNYDDLYKNIAIARDWSAYLSERDDDTGFKFGDYAQNNNLRYRESEDVVKDNGLGVMEIDDETLQAEKDVVQLPVSYSDEVTILNNIFSVDVARIAFNKFNADTNLYDQNDNIDPRIVYVDQTESVGSPPYEKTFGLRATVAPGGEISVSSPKKASTIEVSFSYLVAYYASLSRMLTRTKLRKAKFNLPVYEVAGLKHNIPIYIRQYKAYFYVNKVNNYVPGKLTTIELIKL